MATPTKRPPPPARDRLRAEIEAAEAEGVPREDMTLRLTHGDVAALKRDPAIALADISFSGGVMRYLGVRIQAGGVDASVLDRRA